MSAANSSVIWIHCNSCFHLFNRDRRFFALNCQNKHVLCQYCMAKTNKGTVCPLCKIGISRFIELNNQMSQAAKEYFNIGITGQLYEKALTIKDYQNAQIKSLALSIIERKEKFNKALKFKEAKLSYLNGQKAKKQKAVHYRRQLQTKLRQTLRMRQRSHLNNTSGYSSMIGTTPPRSKIENFFDEASSSSLNITHDFFGVPQPQNEFQFPSGDATPSIARRSSNVVLSQGKQQSRSPTTRVSQQRSHPGYSRSSSSSSQQKRLGTSVSSPKRQNIGFGSYGSQSNHRSSQQNNLPFHSQKASTPIAASRDKVLTQDLSFLSTPSTVGRS
uniref:CSON004786 protein n=1 Tax=Culicoides sonorensis TaxID=179676 RepID=A0A336KJI2_CULSO